MQLTVGPALVAIVLLCHACALEHVDKASAEDDETYALKDIDQTNLGGDTEGALKISTQSRAVRLPTKLTLGVDHKKLKEGGVFSAAAPQQWSGKEREHVPALFFSGPRAVIAQEHRCTPEHYISTHWIEDAAGEVLGENVVFRANEDAKSTMMMPAWTPAGFITAFSHCNVHGVWRSEPVMFEPPNEL